MPDLLKVFEECRDSKCEDVVSKKEIEAAKNQYTKSSAKECKKHKDAEKQMICSFNNLSKSKYQKLLKKRSKCAEKRCAKERAAFRNDFSKSFKKFRKSIKKKKSRRK